MTEKNENRKADESAALTLLALAWKAGAVRNATVGIDVALTAEIDGIVGEFVDQLEPGREYVYQGFVSDALLRRKVEFAYIEPERNASLRATEIMAVVGRLRD